MFFGLILIICSLCGYVWGLAAAVLSLMVVSRTIFSGFWRSLGVMFCGVGVTRGVIFDDFGVMIEGCISDLVLGVA